jgi:hypothetical protein
MSKIAKIALTLIVFGVPALILALGQAPPKVPLSPYVGADGAISVPSDFRASFVHLGTWIVTSQAAAGPGTEGISHANGIHEVYTSAESLKAFRATNAWPDGAMLILEVRPVRWDDLPTGHIMYAGDETEISVMVKDRTNRFKNNPRWGDGWGWGLFKPADSRKNLSGDYKKDCLGCHEVAKESDFVFVQGYPALR